MATGFSRTNDRTRVCLSLVDARCREIYDTQSRRIYSLAFWMTDNKRAAQRLALRTFLRAFACGGHVGTEQVDQAFLAELRVLTRLEAASLDATTAPCCKRIARNIKQVDLEKAMAQLSAAERLIFLLHDVGGYDEGRISRLLRFNQDQVLAGLHCARIRIRELVARMHAMTGRSSLPKLLSS